MWEDEASFWLDGTLHYTWARIGVQPTVDTYGERKTAHIYGAVSLDDAQFSYQFSDVFNGETFYRFLRHLVSRCNPQKLFLIIDNAPWHWLDEEGKQWLRNNHDKIELFRLPSYSPEFNPMEPIWKETRKRTTHNRFYPTTNERDSALRKTFGFFQKNPTIIESHVRRYQ